MSKLSNRFKYDCNSLISLKIFSLEHLNPLYINPTVVLTNTSPLGIKEIVADSSPTFSGILVFLIIITLLSTVFDHSWIQKSTILFNSENVKHINSLTSYLPHNSFQIV